jgi:hypothetical protein
MTDQQNNRTTKKDCDRPSTSDILVLKNAMAHPPSPNAGRVVLMVVGIKDHGQSWKLPYIPAHARLTYSES